MYLESVLKGYKLMPVPENPELRNRLANHSLEELTEMLSQYKALHNSTDVDTVKRAIRAIEIEEYYAAHPVPEREFPELDSLIIGVDIDRELRREKITRRLKQRLDEGMVDEVRRLIEQGIAPDDLIYYGLEYKYLTLYVIGKLTYEEMFNGLEIAIPSVCQATNDLVPRHGKKRIYDPLDECRAADGRKDSFCKRETARELVSLAVIIVRFLIHNRIDKQI